MSGPAQPRAKATIRRRGATPPPAASRRATVADTVAAPPPPPRRRGRSSRKGRRVVRVVRRIELWSVMKVALVFNTVMLIIALGAVALLWALASTTGLVEDLEGFLQESGFQDFRFDGADMFSRVVFIGAVVALATTVFVVLATALVNLISELTGGIRFVVIEEIVPTAAPRRAPAPAAPPPPVVPPGIATGPPPGTPGFPSRPPAAARSGRRPSGATRAPRPEPGATPAPDRRPAPEGPFDVEAHR